MAAGQPDLRAQAGRMLDLLFEGLRRHDWPFRREMRLAASSW